MGTSSPARNALRLLTAALALPIISATVPASPVRADTVTDLQKQQQTLKQQALQAQQQAEAQKTLAQRAAERLSQATRDINQLQGTIDDTSGQIDSLQDQIAAKDQENAALESQLRQQRDQQDSLVRQLYILSVSQPDYSILLSGQPVSEKDEGDAQLQALHDAVTAAALKTQQQQAEVAKARDALAQKQQDLQGYKDQQTQQQRSLADIKQQQASLKSNAEAAEASLEAQAASKAAQAAQIEQKIRLLSATSNWGSQIVSSDDSSWYYTQTGNYTRMGNSWYTVDEVGCFITSIAMVATYYGHGGITPTYLARNSVFSNGYLISLPSGIGITKQPSRPVNWSTVNAEISAGRPVIVSIYLPSVGAVNSDGSSHFIVIKGSANGKYLMHDPIGPGRSYNLNQVRSMVLVRNN